MSFKYNLLIYFLFLYEEVGLGLVFPPGIKARLTVSSWICSFLTYFPSIGITSAFFEIFLFFFFLSFPRFLRAYGKSTLAAHKLPLPALKILGCRLSGAADLKTASLLFLCLRLSMAIVGIFWYMLFFSTNVQQKLT